MIVGRMTELCTPMDSWEDGELFDWCLPIAVITVTVSETLTVKCIHCLNGGFEVRSSTDKSSPLIVTESECVLCGRSMKVWVHSGEDNSQELERLRRGIAPWDTSPLCQTQEPTT